MIVLGLGGAAALLATGQAATVDGIFLLLTCLLVALAFGLYLWFMIDRAKDALKPPPPKKKPGAKSASGEE